MARGRVAGFRNPLADIAEGRLDGLLVEPQHAQTDGRVEQLDADVPLPASLLNEVWPQLSSAAQAVLIPLLQLAAANDGRPFHATMRELQLRAGVSRPKVQRGVTELIARGLVELTECSPGSGGGHLYKMQDLTK
jgi:hypothetical protein